MDATKLEFNKAYDMIYARFTLSHLPNTEDIIKKMITSLKPGGILWCEEMFNSRIFSYPENPAVKQAINLVSQLGSLYGFDANFGASLYSLFAANGLNDIEIAMPQPIFYRGPEKQLLLLSIQEAKEKIITNNIVNEFEFNKLIEELTKFTLYEKNLMALTPIVQVYAYKPLTEKLIG